MICRSVVIVSWALTSVPSLIAFMKLAGVIRLSPSAGACSAKMLSEAPTGDARVAALDLRDQLVVARRRVVSNGALPVGVVARVLGVEPLRGRR